MMFPFRFGIRFLTAGLFLAGIAAGVPVPTFASAYACPFLDEPHEAWREWDIGFVSRGRSGKDREKTSVVETRLRGMLVYWENDGGGDLEVQADVDVRTLSGGVADPSIYALTMARVILQW